MRRPWLRGAPALSLLAAVAALVALSRSGGPAGGGANAGTLRPTAAVASDPGYQELASLTTAHQVFAAPGSRRVGWIAATRPITGEQTVLPVVRTAVRGGLAWLDVRLPGRPNGLTGWIKLRGTKLEYTPWRIAVNLAKRRVYAYEAGRLVRSFRAVVGAPATPTPTGRFFVEENVAEPPSFPGAPYALALSARSNVYQEFDGGPGQIAIHGLRNVGGTPGTAASHGCIRLDTRDIAWLAEHMDPGVPVTIY